MKHCLLLVAGVAATAVSPAVPALVVVTRAFAASPLPVIRDLASSSFSWVRALTSAFTASAAAVSASSSRVCSMSRRISSGVRTGWVSLMA